MLFDKNGFYMIEPHNDYDFAVDIINGNIPGPKMYDPSEALKMGNLFPSLYNQYKDYKPRDLKVYTEREKLLLEIQKLDFSINDLNLYLDLNPDDRDAYRIFKSYVEECKKKKDSYMRIFGPIMLDDITDEYEWSKGVWPWEEDSLI